MSIPAAAIGDMLSRKETASIVGVVERLIKGIHCFREKKLLLTSKLFEMMTVNALDINYLRGPRICLQVLSLTVPWESQRFTN